MVWPLRDRKMINHSWNCTLKNEMKEQFLITENKVETTPDGMENILFRNGFFLVYFQVIRLKIFSYYTTIYMEHLRQWKNTN